MLLRQRVFSTILLILVPWLVLVAIGMSTDDGHLPRSLVVAMFVVWAVGLVLIWRPIHPRN